MKFTEFKSHLEDGTLNIDEDYWVCTYVYSSTTAQQNRHTAPVRVKARMDSKTTFWGGSRRITQNVFVHSYLKTGSLSAGHLQMYGLEVFTNERECRERYDQLLDEAQDNLIEYRRSVEEKVKSTAKKLEAMKRSNQEKKEIMS